MENSKFDSSHYVPLYANHGWSDDIRKNIWFQINHLLEVNLTFYHSYYLINFFVLLFTNSLPSLHSSKPTLIVWDFIIKCNDTKLREQYTQKGFDLLIKPPTHGYGITNVSHLHLWNNYSTWTRDYNWSTYQTIHRYILFQKCIYHCL